MDFGTIDLVGLVGTIMGISIILVPVLGITARFVMKPLVEALGQSVQARQSDETVRILERRLALLEQQIETLDSSVTRLAEAAEFHRELRSGASPQIPTHPTEPPRATPGDRRT